MVINISQTYNILDGSNGKAIIPFTIPSSFTNSTITELDCGAAFNPPFGSLWLAEVTVSYNGSTATDTNYVDFGVVNLGAFSFSRTHFVNFSLHTYMYRDTFTVFFSSSKRLVFRAQTNSMPPTGKNYKISTLNVMFTRIA